MSKRPASGSIPDESATLNGDMAGVDGALPAKKQRKLVRNDTNKQVTNKLWDHFRDFSDVQRFVLTYEGLTLEETLVRDTRFNKAGKPPTMGAEYYKLLRKRFLLQSSPSAQLAASDPSEEIRPVLREAYKAFKGRPVNRTLLLQFFKNHQYLNNRETVGVAKAVLEHNPNKSPDQRFFILGAMSWFRENDLADKVGSSTKLSSPWLVSFVITLGSISQQPLHAPCLLSFFAIVF